MTESQSFVKHFIRVIFLAEFARLAAQAAAVRAPQNSKIGVVADRVDLLSLNLMI